ncbi:MAG TPA: hypothetical protein VF519_08715 [Mycobacteriales bacterium]
MPYSPEEFYARCLAHADAEHRLPMPDQSMWEIFPFENEGLRAKPLEPPVLPEPPRRGEDGDDCGFCADPMRDAIWHDERWVLTAWREPLGLPMGVTFLPKAHLDLGDLDDTHAADLGRLVVHTERAIRGLGDIGRVHLYKWGDGGAHLHVMLLARPAGLLQLRGSNLPLWEEMLPRVDKEVWDADARAVARALAESYGGEAR